MLYHAVHLPLALSRDFHYSSPEPLLPGVRVLVSFKGRDMIGICGEALREAPSDKISYRPILEVLDEKPVLSPKLMELARFMADYYHCSMGSACFAMLPAWLIPDVDAEVNWLADGIPAGYEELAALLKDDGPKRLSELRKQLRGKPVLRLVEEGAEAGILELKRKLSSKDKPKILNYVRLLERNPDLDVFPVRQRELLQMLLEMPDEEFPLARIADVVSYSVVNALQKKGMLSIAPKEVEREFFSYEGGREPKTVVLNEEQLQAVKDIFEGDGSASADLLFGITGSGKTEVYIPLIRECLKKGSGVIFLIPEIALTPQMVERFQGEFGSILAISHSQLSNRQRLDQWRKIASGQCRIVIGARSAVFSPLPDLGLIIVDEEHEQSYKQDSSPRYNGRDLAVMRAKIEGARIVLGSATPSLESWQNQTIGKYALHTLASRPLDVQLPEVEVISLREDYDQQLLSNELIAAIGSRLEKQEQVILFQNRRGFSSFMQCLKCGELIKCSNCEISMYYHRDREEMQCHYCGNSHPSPRKCPHCGSFSFSYGSPGTQKVEQILHILFPQARILRLDSDSARRQESHKSMYRRMKDHEVDILLGTQMISKGLDFPNVTLVGIVNADISLNVPDFRSAERTFQLCTQVAGRAGRADKRGEVIIQTHNPDHYAIVHAAAQDYRAFAREELSHRRQLNYPPFYRLGRILFQSNDCAQLEREMEILADVVHKISASFHPDELFLLGPAPAPMAVINNQHRWHLILKALTPAILKRAVAKVFAVYSPSRVLRAYIDIDPLNLM
ncbi:MAG: primosomal protein N' [Candidatus Cloacimonetes bacterium]|nr:primosomal protein N' [Candidatus Cloacimonadota bacterium]